MTVWQGERTCIPSSKADVSSKCVACCHQGVEGQSRSPSLFFQDLRGFPRALHQLWGPQARSLVLASLPPSSQPLSSQGARSILVPIVLTASPLARTPCLPPGGRAALPASHAICTWQTVWTLWSSQQLLASPTRTPSGVAKMIANSEPDVCGPTWSGLLWLLKKIPRQPMPPITSSLPPVPILGCLELFLATY